MAPKRPRLAHWLGAALLAAVCMTGCGETPDRSLIKSGHYRLQGGVHHDTKLGMTLTIDRGARTATFSFPDGSSRTLGWTPKPEDQWVNGCWPDESDWHTKMEVAPLNTATLQLEATTLENPRLVAGCPEGTDTLGLAPEGGYIASGLLAKVETHQCEIEVTCFLFAMLTR